MTHPATRWTPFQRWLIRFSFLYFVLQIFPIQINFYKQLAGISWKFLLIDLLNLSTYTPHFFGENSTLVDWVVIAGIALLGSFIWLSIGKNRQQVADDQLYYYLRILVRFRLATTLFAFGFIKLFPLFAPELSISHLNTGYGYFNQWKQLFLSLGIVPGYVSYLGIVEVLTGILLLFRKTAFLGVLFIIPFYGNIFMANLAYEGGAYVFSLFLLSLAFVLFLYDVNRFARLIIWQKVTAPASFKPTWSLSPFRNGRIVLKIGFVVIFFFIYGFKSYTTYQHGSLYYPSSAGLKDAAGLYYPSLFIRNNDTIAYAPKDTFRWRDVVFEKWNTISIRSNRHVLLNKKSNFSFSVSDSLRDYEYSQTGERQYYRYHFANSDSSLILENENPNYAGEKLKLRVFRPDSLTIILNGLDQNGDSLLVKLDKADKKYLIEEVKRVGRSTLGFKL